jgi:uncharacterized protein YcnI
MKRTITLPSAALGVGVLLALAAPLSASAHVGVSATTTVAGAYSVLTFSVGHGCEGSPTTQIAISLPESIADATPTVNPSWTISKVKDGDRTTQVVYTAITPLAADQRDTFALSLALAGEPGDVLEFPTLQTCEVGETNWAGAEVPAVTLTAGEAAGHHDEVAAASTGSDDVLARGLGIAGIVVGAIGITAAVAGRKRTA